MTPQELKNSILQQTIQGKLVDSDVRELPVDLPVINPDQKIIDEFDFEIPGNWEIVYFETISRIIPSKQYQILESQVLQTGKFPVISQSKEYSIGFSNDESKVFHHDKPVIIFGDHTTEVKFVEFDFIVGADGVKIFEPNYDVVNEKYLLYLFQFYTKDLNKIGGYSRHYKYIKSKPIPLPPLAEQKRIVAKIEELLPYIDRYEEAWRKLESFNNRFPDDMKKSLLQYAIQGKLVEQRPEEGTAEELFEQIQKEKQRLIADGKIKKEKPLPEITEEEKPFDIPESWKWVRLGEIFNVIMGQSPSGTSVSENGNGLEFHQGKIYFGDDYLKVSPQITNEITKIAEAGSILLCVRAPVGVVNIVQRRICIGRGLCALTSSIMDKKFILYFIRSFESDFVKKSTGTTFKAITNDVIKNQLFPLPPLAEQKRIVAKLEQLLPLCDRLK